MMALKNSPQILRIWKLMTVFFVYCLCPPGSEAADLQKILNEVNQKMNLQGEVSYRENDFDQSGTRWKWHRDKPRELPVTLLGKIRNPEGFAIHILEFQSAAEAASALTETRQYGTIMDINPTGKYPTLLQEYEIGPGWGPSSRLLIRADHLVVEVFATDAAEGERKNLLWLIGEAVLTKLDQAPRSSPPKPAAREVFTALPPPMAKSTATERTPEPPPSSPRPRQPASPDPGDQSVPKTQAPNSVAATPDPDAKTRPTQVLSLGGAAPSPPKTNTSEADPVSHATAPPVRGDTDNDGRLTPRDAAIALKMSVGLIPQNLEQDISGNGRVESEDARIILQDASPMNQ